MPSDATGKPVAATDYLYFMQFNHERFRNRVADAFRPHKLFDAAAVPAAEQLLGFMEDDPAITDVRWMAYMLATAYWETALRRTRHVLKLTSHGKQILDKKTHQPALKTVHEVKTTMLPVREDIKRYKKADAKDYFEPVKVTVLRDGGAHLIEKDGYTWQVHRDGTYLPINSPLGSIPGVAFGTPADPAYVADGGTEQIYYGRGYCQLTWWYNYAAAGAALGRGTDYLLKPDSVLEPKTAYQIMSHGMRTGTIFANAKTFNRYFHGSKRKYLEARHMVNGHDCAHEIASIAEKFEKALLESRV
jgi:hypothetical protein